MQAVVLDLLEGQAAIGTQLLDPLVGIYNGQLALENLSC